MTQVETQNFPRALVTGASSGLGREIARILFRKGYAVTLVGRSEAALRALAAENARAEIFPCDLGRRRETRALCERLEREPFSAFVHCAGFGAIGEARALAEETLDFAEVHFSATVLLTCAFLKGLENNRIENGRALVAASAAAFAPAPYFAGYAATKSAEYAWSRALAEELRAGGSGARVSVLCSGALRTAFDERAGIAARKGMNAEKCAKIAVAGMLRGKPLILPDWRAKFGKFFVRILPERTLVRAARRIQSRKRSKS